MKKKLLTALLCMTMFGVTACGNTDSQADATTEKESVAAEGTEEAEVSTVEKDVVADAEETISVVDQNGMTAEITANPERLVTTALPLPSIYALTGAPIEYLIGVHPGSTSAIENSVMAAMFSFSLRDSS